MPPGDSIFKLAAKGRIKELLESSEDKTAAKEQIEKVSLAYQVLSEETAFIGIVKQNDQVVGELKQIKVLQDFMQMPMVYEKQLLASTI